MTNKLSDQHKKTLNQIRSQAQQTLKLCDEAEQGKISGEEFEKRVSKTAMPRLGQIRAL